MNVVFKGYETVVKFDRYADNNNVALQLFGKIGTDYENEPIAIASVNTDVQLYPDYIAIKNWSENAGIVDALIDSGVIENKREFGIPCGFVSADVHKLTKKAIDVMESEDI